MSFGDFTWNQLYTILDATTLKTPGDCVFVCVESDGQSDWNDDEIASPVLVGWIGWGNRDFFSCCSEEATDRLRPLLDDMIAWEMGNMKRLFVFTSATQSKYSNTP